MAEQGRDESKRLLCPYRLSHTSVERRQSLSSLQPHLIGKAHLFERVVWGLRYSGRGILMKGFAENGEERPGRGGLSGRIRVDLNAPVLDLHVEEDR